MCLPLSKFARENRHELRTLHADRAADGAHLSALSEIERLAERRRQADSRRHYSCPQARNPLGPDASRKRELSHALLAVRPLARNGVFARILASIAVDEAEMAMLDSARFMAC